MFAPSGPVSVFHVESVLMFRSEAVLTARVEDHHRTLVLTDASGESSVWVRQAPRAHVSGRQLDTALSGAERRVVALVADGLTNRVIAERLHVSVRTVDSHVSHALLKLGMTSRVQLAGYALRGAA